MGFLPVCVCGVTSLKITSDFMCCHQAPAVYRKIPVYRDFTQIPIPGFLKIKYRYFSVLLYSTQDNIFKDLYWFLANFGDILGLSEPLKVF